VVVRAGATDRHRTGGTEPRQHRRPLVWGREQRVWHEHDGSGPAVERDVSDLVVLMARDHRSISDTCALLEVASGHNIGPLLRRLVDQVLRHEIAEEAVFYPELLAVAGGEIVAERLVREHWLWDDLIDLEATISNPERRKSDLSPRRLSSSVRRHLETEEGIAFPLMVTGVHRSRLHDLGARYAEIRKIWLLQKSPVGDGASAVL
jgi:hypothetical protein